MGCGHSAQTSKCQSCGRTVSVQAKFCQNCGNSLVAADPKKIPVVVAVVVEGNEVVESSEVVESNGRTVQASPDTCPKASPKSDAAGGLAVQTVKSRDWRLRCSPKAELHPGGRGHWAIRGLSFYTDAECRSDVLTCDGFTPLGDGHFHGTPEEILKGGRSKGNLIKGNFFKGAASGAWIGFSVRDPVPVCCFTVRRDNVVYNSSSLVLEYKTDSGI